MQCSAVLSSQISGVVLVVAVTIANRLHHNQHSFNPGTIVDIVKCEMNRFNKSLSCLGKKVNFNRKQAQ